MTNNIQDLISQNKILKAQIEHHKKILEKQKELEEKLGGSLQKVFNILIERHGEILRLGCENCNKPFLSDNNVKTGDTDVSCSHCGYILCGLCHKTSHNCGEKSTTEFSSVNMD